MKMALSALTGGVTVRAKTSTFKDDDRRALACGEHLINGTKFPLDAGGAVWWQRQPEGAEHNGQDALDLMCRKETALAQGAVTLKF